MRISKAKKVIMRNIKAKHRKAHFQCVVCGAIYYNSYDAIECCGVWYVVVEK